MTPEDTEFVKSVELNFETTKEGKELKASIDRKVHDRTLEIYTELRALTMAKDLAYRESIDSKAFLLLPVLLLSSFFWAFLAHAMYRWFAAPLLVPFGWPAIDMWNFYGLALFFAVLKNAGAKANRDTPPESFDEQVQHHLVSFLGMLLIYGIAYAVHRQML